MNAVFDTTILIDYLNGVPKAAVELERYDRVSISVISGIEVMVGVEASEDEAIVRDFLGTFDVREVDAAIAERTVAIRRARRIRIPDAIIEATARELGALLVTRNTKDFPAHDPGIRFPYKVGAS